MRKRAFTGEYWGQVWGCDEVSREACSCLWSSGHEVLEEDDLEADD